MRTMKPHADSEEMNALVCLIRYGDNNAATRRLLETYGSARTALSAGPALWRAAGISLKACRALQAPDQARIDQDIAWWQQSPAHHVVAWHQEDYPSLLRHVDSPPAALFVKGKLDALWHPQIAMVGSRHATHSGKQIAQEFAESFVSAGWAVISGLAQGIDTYAHLGALRVEQAVHPATLAVVATGLDLVYPQSNQALMQKIADCGAVISEHPPGTPALKAHFPSRNRIIAGLSLGCVVVEAAQRSGALITARLANELGKEVFAIPGCIQNPLARGCHQLIRQGAWLIENAEEVSNALTSAAAHLAEALRGRLDKITITPDSMPTSPSRQTELPLADNVLQQSLGYEPCTLDQLCERTGLTASELSSMLLVMEMEGRVAQQQGRYVRLI
jgi:DNA processing protein